LYFNVIKDFFYTKIFKIYLAVHVELYVDWPAIPCWHSWSRISITLASVHHHRLYGNLCWTED